jgi:putative addiction module component (TIGR02574 family)
MTAAAQELLEKVMQLPVKDRDWIAESIMRSQESADDFEPDDPQFAAMLERRREEARTGKVRMVPHEEVMARLRESFPQTDAGG